MRAAAIYEHLLLKLRGIVPEFELRLKAEVAEEILRLKAEKDAVILGHNYMEPALFHSIPDFVGDSLELCRRAASTGCRVIVFCGVRFMAETAKILNPGKTVLLPSLEAGCSLAASITAADVQRLRQRFPAAPVVSYVNTYADVKAESDVCCTSSNAAAVVESLGADTVLFVPDEYLARNVARQTGRRVVVTGRDEDDRGVPAGGPVLIGWRGRCEVHELFTVDDVRAVRAQFPDVAVLAHPECSPDVVEASDFSGSTTAMIEEVRRTAAPRVLLLTECSMGDNIVASAPGKELLRLCSHRCPHMGQITLEDTLEALRAGQHVIDVPAGIRERARGAVERMIAVGAVGQRD